MIVKLTMLGGFKMQDTLEDFKKQHLDNYKNAVVEILKNNSTILIDEDIMSLLKKPPLDSMDVIKCKFLDLAKKQKIILNTEELDKLIELYRNDVILFVASLKSNRISELTKIVNEFDPKKENDIIKFNKKDFTSLNKNIRKEIKTAVNESIEKNIVNNVNSVFTKDVDDIKRAKIITDVSKFLTNTYQKQLLESVDIKVLVKDTTLINGVREQGERYLFTKMNSYLLNENKSKVND